MAKLIVMYNRPADPAAFNDYYFNTHVPLAKTVPGIRGYSVSSGSVYALQGPSPFHMIATLEFDSVADLQAAVASPQGQRTAADLANFADGGAQMLVFEEKHI